MRHLLRNKTVLRLVALATAGSELLCFNSDGSSRTSISVSIPPPLHEPLSSLWNASKDMIKSPFFVSLDNMQYVVGNLPQYFSRSSLVPSEDSSIPTGVGDEPKPCRGCFGTDTMANAATKVGPAVVNLSVPQGFHGLPVRKSIGSGAIIDSTGMILTCPDALVDSEYLFSSSMGKVEVTLQDGRTFGGTVVFADPFFGIAIVKIKSISPLPTAKLGSSSKLRPGDRVLTMGCPLSLQNTVTERIVSCVDQKVSHLGLGEMRTEYPEIDCAVNYSISGGPLVNIHGEVVGVNSMDVLAADGQRFAIAVDSVSIIITYFRMTRMTGPPWIGLKGVSLDDMVVAQLKKKDPLFPDVDKGVPVHFVVPGSPADRAGFCPGDVVLEFAGRPVGSMDEIVEIMGNKVGFPQKTLVRKANGISEVLTVIPEEATPFIMDVLEEYFS